MEYPVARSASLHCDEGYNDNMICVVQTMHSKIRITDNAITDGTNVSWNVTFVVVVQYRDVSEFQGRILHHLDD